MTQHRWVRGAFGLSVLMATAATPALAQPLGVFRWQTQPFCNVLTLAVTASAAGFRMEGTDDSCGGVPASAIGMAYPKPDGTIGVGLTLVFSSAVSLHVDGTIIPGAGFNGSWSDSVGRAGTLLLTPGASIGGPLRPVVAPVVTYGSTVTQPPGGSDKGLSATVTADTGTPNNAAALLGHFGGPLALTSPAPAGVVGESPANVGVMGLTDTGFAVVGGADTGVGVQGYATNPGPNSIAVQAVHINGGTALDIYNGSIKVSGTVRTAFTYTAPFDGTAPSCRAISHPLLDGDPTALVFVTSQNSLKPALGINYVGGPFGWVLCTGASAVLVGGDKVNVLVIKQ
jgi:hypothetical protein